MFKKSFFVTVFTAVFVIGVFPVATLSAAENTPVVPKNSKVRATTSAGVIHDKAASTRLAKQLTAINTLSAEFRQSSADNEGRIKEQLGKMLLKRPNQFRWDTVKPFPQEIISTEDKLWMIDTDLMQVVIKKQDKNSGATPVQLLSGNAEEFLKNYNVVQLENKRGEVFTLKPIQDNDLFEQLDIHFVSGELLAMVLKDTLGGKSKIEFSNVSINNKISDDNFKPVIPKGFDIIDETNP